MEVERDILRPKSSLIRLLMQQVEEQSEHCDITVRVGQWEKNFHRCVLTASPFFENAINGNFLEKRRGIVEISVGSHKYVEMALMFLYGEEPYITIDIVEDLLEIADFFMIKSLKYICFRWLDNLDISHENCMQLLQLSLAVGFEVTNCIKYIESHLSEVLKEEGAIQLSKDSVMYLFSDRRFSYVTMDERMKFLVNWFKKHHEERKLNVKELFKTIDLSEVSESVWDDTKLVSAFSKAVDLEHAVRVPENKTSSRTVLIMTGTNDLFWCLDFKKKQWYGLKSDFFKKTVFNWGESKDITGIIEIRNRFSEVYFVSKYTHSELTTSNLETNETNTYTLTPVNKVREGFRNINVKANIVFACLEVARYEGNVLIINSVLYKGYMYLSRQNVHMRPILSLLNENISKMCIGNSSVALLLKSKQAVIIFDFADYHLDKFGLTLEKDDTIVTNNDGFVIFNNKRCHFISRLSGPSLPKKYLLEEIKLENEKKRSLRYMFYRNIWLRLECSHLNDDLQLQYVLHRKLVAGQCSGGVHWKNLPVSMPQEIEGFRQQIMTTNLFFVRLSINKLQCYIVCPHCDNDKTPKRRDEWRNSWSNNSYSEEYEGESDTQLSYYDNDSE